MSWSLWLSSLFAWSSVLEPLKSVWICWKVTQNPNCHQIFLHTQSRYNCQIKWNLSTTSIPRLNELKFVVIFEVRIIVCLGTAQSSCTCLKSHSEHQLFRPISPHTEQIQPPNQMEFIDHIHSKTKLVEVCCYLHSSNFRQLGTAQNKVDTSIWQLLTPQKSAPWVPVA